jgi:hypothetical protein
MRDVFQRDHRFGGLTGDSDDRSIALSDTWLQGVDHRCR